MADLHGWYLRFQGFIFILVVTVAVVRAENDVHQHCKLSFPEITSKQQESTVSVREADHRNCDMINRMTDSMIELDVLSSQTSSCYSIQKISRVVSEKTEGTPKRQISVTFHFEENFDDSFSRSLEKSQRDSPGGDVTSVICRSSGETYKRAGFLRGHQSMSMVGGAGGSNGTKNGSTVVAASHSKDKSNADDDSAVLSHTQVVVIATCSSVIGTFFIVAAVMRIRNYMKRRREEQVNSTRPYTRPGCGGEMTSEPCNGSRERIQSRDSTSSKGSRQSASTTKGGNRYFPVNNHGIPSSPTESPKHFTGTEDTNPLLVVTAPSASPSDSHASIQFIDEETENGKTEDPVVDEKEPLISSENPPAAMTVSVDSISSEGEVCNEDSPACCLSSRSENPVVSVPQPVVEEEKLLGNSNASCENCVLENMPSDVVGLSEESSISNEINSSNSSDMAVVDMLSVTAGLTQSDESLSGSHNASYSYGNQVEYANMYYDDECDSGNGDVEMLSVSPECDSKDEMVGENTSDSDDTSKMVDNLPVGSSSSSPDELQCDNSDVKDLCGNLIDLSTADDNKTLNDNETKTQSTLIAMEDLNSIETQA